MAEVDRNAVAGDAANDAANTVVSGVDQGNGVDDGGEMQLGGDGEDDAANAVHVDAANAVASGVEVVAKETNNGAEMQLGGDGEDEDEEDVDMEEEGGGEMEEEDEVDRKKAKPICCQQDIKVMMRTSNELQGSRTSNDTSSDGTLTTVCCHRVLEALKEARCFDGGKLIVADLGSGGGRFVMHAATFEVNGTYPCQVVGIEADANRVLLSKDALRRCTTGVSRQRERALTRALFFHLFYF